MARLEIERAHLQACVRDCEALARLLWRSSSVIDPSMRGALAEGRKKMEYVRDFLRHLDRMVETLDTEDDEKIQGKTGKEKKARAKAEITIASRPKFTKEALQGIGE
jgi:hypothetical protein